MKYVLIIAGLVLAGVVAYVGFGGSADGTSGTGIVDQMQDAAGSAADSMSDAASAAAEVAGDAANATGEAMEAAAGAAGETMDSATETASGLVEDGQDVIGEGMHDAMNEAASVEEALMDKKDELDSAISDAEKTGTD